MAGSEHVSIQGHVSPGFEVVREAFVATLLDAENWGAPAASITEATKLWTSGAVSETSGPASLGNRTLWF